jgi:hypothetical protein
VNVANPDAPALISGSDVMQPFQSPSAGLALNGSGVGVLVGFDGNQNSFYLMDSSDANETYTLITRFPLPGTARDVAIASGIAFVAGGEGMQVVNYRSFDANGQPPTVTISAAAADLDDATPGIQVLSSSLVPLAADIRDDVQVRNVELLVNGVVTANDVSFPIDLAAFAVPADSSVNTSRIQVRVTDTGGNVTLSEEIVLDLVPDTFAPQVAVAAPSNGQNVLSSFSFARLGFNEPLDPLTVDVSAFSLRSSTGQVLAATAVSLSGRDTLVRIAFPALDEGDYELIVAADVLSDRAGNVIGEEIVPTSFTVTDATIAWAGAGAGFWDVPTNWTGGVLPGPDDIVLIDAASDITVTHRSGDTTVSAIIANETFVLQGGTVAVADRLLGSGSYVMRGGSVAGDLTNEGLVIVEGTGVTFAGTFRNEPGGILRTEATAAQHGVIRVENGMVNRGRIELTSSFGTARSATLEVANGVLVNETEGAIISLPGTAGGARTIGAILDNRGTLDIQQALTLNRSDVEHINGGTIRAGASLEFAGQDVSFTNSSTIEVTAGRVVSIPADFTMEENGSLDLEIAGVAPIQIGRIVVGDLATLAGSLGVSLAAGFQATPGMMFPVIQYASRTGEFATVDGGSVVYAANYGPTSLTLTVSAAGAESEAAQNPAPLFGDFDGSGIVDRADLDLVLFHWGDGAAEFPAEGIGPTVDEDELDAVLLNWGSALPRAAASLPPLVPAPLRSVFSENGFVRLPETAERLRGLAKDAVFALLLFDAIDPLGGTGRLN